MSMIYGLFAAEATTVDGVTVYDRSVGDEFFKELFSAIAHNGVVGTGFEVGADSGLTVSVAAGGAVIEGHFCYDKSAASLTIGAVSSARTDLIVLRLDITNRQITLAVAADTTTVTRSANVYELALARIDLPANTTTITGTMITDLRSNAAYCGAAGATIAADASMSSSSTNAVQNQAVELAKLNKPAQIAFSTGATLALADNTEYRASAAITTLTLTYPEGNFECWIKFTTGATTPTITRPAASKYSGVAPTFGAAETWELSIKDGVIVAQEAS